MSAERAERKLSAILAADVAGYSRLMGIDEEGTLGRLNGIRRELLAPCIREHRGRVVKTTGDGFLAEFASVVDALRCAVELQAGMYRRNAEVESTPTTSICRLSRISMQCVRTPTHMRSIS
jgi:adenylate cyclase